MPNDEMLLVHRRLSRLLLAPDVGTVVTRVLVDLAVVVPFEFVAVAAILDASGDDEPEAPF
jgi:hypothetical protein